MFGGGSTEKDENADDNVVDTIEETNTTVLDDSCSQTVTDEDKDGVLDGEESIVECAAFDEEPEPVDRIHRLSWRKGTQVETQSTLLRGSGAWSALATKKTENSFADTNPPSPQSVTSLTRGDKLFLSASHGDSKYDCAWDALFSEDLSEEDGTRMDQLLDLFENEMPDEDDSVVTSRSSTPANTFSQESGFEAVPLTQRGESVADTIEQEIMSDPIRMQSIEAVCPKWRDNIRYALAQRGPAEIRQALERVRRSMTNLQNIKQKVSTVWTRQEVVLQLFEATLSASLSRLPSDGSPESNSFEDDEPAPFAPPVQVARTTVLSPIIEGDEALMQPSQ